MSSARSSRSFPRGMTLLVSGALFMEILDATIIAPAIPQMAESFGAQPVDVGVAISAYLVTVAVLIPATGSASSDFCSRCASFADLRRRGHGRWTGADSC